MFLRKLYPSLYIFVLRCVGQTERVDKVMEEYKDHHTDPETMQQYIHLHWIPHLDKMRQEGKLHTGKKEIQINGFKYQYEGELD